MSAKSKFVPGLSPLRARRAGAPSRDAHTERTVDGRNQNTHLEWRDVEGPALADGFTKIGLTDRAGSAARSLRGKASRCGTIVARAGSVCPHGTFNTWAATAEARTGAVCQLFDRRHGMVHFHATQPQQHDPKSARHVQRIQTGRSNMKQARLVGCWHR